jgi:hypothetical protein
VVDVLQFFKKQLVNILAHEILRNPRFK